MNYRTISTFVAWLVAGVLLSVGSATAASDQLVVAIRGGTLGDFYIKVLGPMFQKQFGPRVVFTVATSGPALAKVRAEARNPQTDVLWTTAPTQFEGERRELFAKIDYGKVPNVKDVDPSLVDPDGYFVAKSIQYIGIAYNPELFKAKGFAAPTSWRDLLRPEFRRHVAIESPADSFGQATIGGLVSVLSGRQTDEAAKAVVDQLVGAGPDILWATSPSHMAQLLTQQDAWIAAFGDARAWELMDQGASLAFVIPKEGGFPIPSYWALVKNAPNPEAALQWINWHLSPEIQAMEAREAFRFPVNVKAGPLLHSSDKLNERVGGNVHAVPVDWKWVDGAFAGWVKRLQLGR